VIADLARALSRAGLFLQRSSQEVSVLFAANIYLESWQTAVNDLVDFDLAFIDGTRSIKVDLSPRVPN
jgi:hypothetical protein